MKILIINLMPAIGEFLFVTPVFNVIKHAFPKATIEALVASEVYPICRYNRNIDQIIAFDKRGKQAGLLAHLRLIKELRQADYDLVINLNPSERASFIAAFSGGKKFADLPPGVLKDFSFHI